MNSKRQFLSRVLRGVAILCLAGSVSAAETNEAAAVKLEKKVVVEQWTPDFPAALAQARAERRPLILFGHTKDCPFCKRLKNAFDSEPFAKWIKGTGIYLVDTRYDMTNRVAKMAQSGKFLNELPFKNKSGLPHVGVYWPKSSNDEVRVAFTARRGYMPGQPNPLLVGEFISSMDDILKDYFAARGERAKVSLEGASDVLVKRIRAVAEGNGTVVMTPPSGEIVEHQYVQLVAKPAPGAVFVGWREPSGKMMRSRVKQLRVRYIMDEGTYTAIFK